MGGSWVLMESSPLQAPALSTHGNSTNICPIRTLVRHQMIYSLGSSSAVRQILLFGSRCYPTVVFAFS